VFVAVGIKCAMRMLHIVMWPARLYIFPRYFIHGTIFEGKKVIQYAMCVLTLYTFCLRHFSILEEMSGEM